MICNLEIVINLKNKFHLFRILVNLKRKNVLNIEKKNPTHFERGFLAKLRTSEGRSMQIYNKYSNGCWLLPVLIAHNVLGLADSKANFNQTNKKVCLILA